MLRFNGPLGYAARHGGDQPDTVLHGMASLTSPLYLFCVSVCLAMKARALKRGKKKKERSRKEGKKVSGVGLVMKRRREGGKDKSSRELPFSSR